MSTRNEILAPGRGSALPCAGVGIVRDRGGACSGPERLFLGQNKTCAPPTGLLAGRTAACLPLSTGEGGKLMWNQVYNPLNNAALSTIAAALPVVTLLVLIASGKVKAHIAALIALIVANIITIVIFTMPANMSIRASLLGVVVGFFPIGWIVLNVIFLYRITVETGRFELLKRAVGGVTEDRRLQLLLIAFSFGAFFEGAPGFGTPVAITGSVLIGLGFSPLAASGLSLIANTAPVAYGALGTPIQGLAQVTGLDPYILGAMVGRQLPVYSLIVQIG